MNEEDGCQRGVTPLMPAQFQADDSVNRTEATLRKHKTGAAIAYRFLKPRLPGRDSTSQKRVKEYYLDIIERVAVGVGMENVCSHTYRRNVAQDRVVMMSVVVYQGDFTYS